MPLENYETVEMRIDKFYQKHPDGRIHTDIHHFDSTMAVVKAYVYVEDVVVATGYAMETAGSSQVNKTSYLENCESSAIGRALANYNFAKHGARPSREEMQKVYGYQESSEAPVTPDASSKLAKQVMAIIYGRYPDKLKANATLNLIPSLYGIKGNMYDMPEAILRIIVRNLIEKENDKDLDVITYLKSRLE